MPAVQTCSRTSSRIAFLKYFAIDVGERVRRLVPVEPGRHPQRRRCPPATARVRRSPTAAQSPTDGS